MTIEHLRQLHQQADQGEWQALDDGVCRAKGGDWIASTDDGDFGRINAVHADLIAAMRNTLPHLLDIAETANIVNTERNLTLKSEWERLALALAHLEET